MALPTEVQQYAATHHGLVTRAVLARAEFTPDRIAGAAIRGDLARVHQGVFRLLSVPRSWEQRVLAACLATGGVASHRSAQRLWAADPTDTVDDDRPVDVTVARSSSPSLTGATVHPATDLDVGSCPTRSGIPVTSPARMLVDLSATAPADELAEALRRCVAAEVITIDEARWELTRPRAGTGGDALRQILREYPLTDPVEPPAPYLEPTPPHLPAAA